MKPEYIISLSDQRASLEVVGGKGASLARLLNAKLPVPAGFHVTTAAYREFVRVNNLQPMILEMLGNADLSKPLALETISRSIQDRFLLGQIPDDIVQAIARAYEELPGDHPIVAVRSSATTEDLPDLSFAGQQESFLNIHGMDSVQDAVKRCWASLWTARAIGYRAQHSIDQSTVSLAVVVQILVHAEASGILFTANPVTGQRDQAIINASWGLGEAIVGGLVTPDTYTVEKPGGRILSREIADKQVMTVLLESNTAEHAVPETMRHVPALSDEQVIELVKLGFKIEELYQTPMDIEWALAEGQLSILQARPVTAMQEAPIVWRQPNPKGVYMRTSVVDLMPDPVSPLFATLGIPSLIAQMYPLGRKLTRSEPLLPKDYYTIINGYAYMNAHFTAREWRWILFGLLPAYPRMLRMLVPFWRDEARPQYQKAVAAWGEKDIAQMSGPELWQGINAIMDAAAYYTSALLFATMGASAGSEGLLTKVYNKMAYRDGDPPATALLMGWDNLPCRAEKSLYDLAKFCREHETLANYVLRTPSSELVERLNGDDVPGGVDPGDWKELHQRFDRHLKEFGHMIFELDFAKPLPRDHPEPMLEAVKMYLRGEGVNPYERQKASQQKRIQTAENVLGRLKGFRRWVFRMALNWAQSLSEVREDALADIGLGYPSMRRMLHVLGEKLVKSGALLEAADIFWLEKGEVEKALMARESGSTLESMGARIQQRKVFFHKVRQVTPPPILPPRKKYLGINTSVWLAESEGNQKRDMLKGVPASPGRVTAPACVLHDPEDFNHMRPGDVLVAGATTPAWTPLFAMASAVVTDIGGPLSHGSIVAREYGIPAVMGTGIATRSIQNGQIVTVDGSAGLVMIGNGRN